MAVLFLEVDPRVLGVLQYIVMESGACKVFLDSIKKHVHVVTRSVQTILFVHKTPTLVKECAC